MFAPDVLDDQIGSPSLAAAFAASVSTAFGPEVDLIVPCEGLLCSALYHSGVRDVKGVPVLDAFGAAFAFGQMLVRLRATSGLAVSRTGLHAKPTKHAMDHLRGVTIEILQTASASAARSSP